MICNPEETIFEDVATATFVNNSDMGGRDEKIGILKSVVKATESYPFDIDTNPLKNYEAPEEEEEGADSEYLPKNSHSRKIPRAMVKSKSRRQYSIPKIYY